MLTDIAGKGKMQRAASRNGTVQMVRISVEVPKNLTKPQKDALLAFEEKLSEKNYEKRKGFFDKIKEKFANK